MCWVSTLRCVIVWTLVQGALALLSNSLIDVPLRNLFNAIDDRTSSHVKKLTDLYREYRIDPLDFKGVDGYGHGDSGREKYEEIIARLMGSEASLARLQFFSGTHAISTALFACLRPGDDFLSVSGQSYDTLDQVIGSPSESRQHTGSLLDWGIRHHQVPLKIIDSDNYFEASFDLEGIADAIRANDRIKLVHVQRSCGYRWRPSIPINEISRLCSFIRREFPSRALTIFCDNCYGELVEDKEPCHVGVDIVAGSLIKNLGGTITPAGGYIAGRKELIERCRAELSAPGIEGGATFGQYRNIFQGLFMSPVFIGESLKGTSLLADFMTKQGFACNPPSHSHRTDVVQGIRLNSRERMVKFCQIAQKLSPVNAYIHPVPGRTEGYADEVIFADGSFIEGSTSELSADGPLREPYAIFAQGGVHWSQWAAIVQELSLHQEFVV